MNKQMRRLCLLTLGVVLTLFSQTAAARQTPSTSAARPVVFFDTDMDLADAVALAALAAQHRRGLIDLRAVTITNNGAGLPGQAYRHARCLLDSFGLDEIPAADATYNLPHVFPDVLRFTFDAILSASVPDCAAGRSAPARAAGALLADEIERADARVTVIATGPLTNVAEAVARLDQGRPSRAAFLIRRFYAQGGAIDVPGGLEGVEGFDNTQTLNIWGGEAGAQYVFASLRPAAIHLVAADATNFVPIRAPFVAGLTAAARTPEAVFVARLMNHPILLYAVGAGLRIYWWDPLAALSGTDARLVEYRWKRIAVVQGGASAGRTIESADGVRMRVGMAADQTLFEAALLEALNGAADFAPRTNGQSASIFGRNFGASRQRGD